MVASMCFNCHSPLTPGEDICDNCGAVNSPSSNSQNNVSSAGVCPNCHFPLKAGEDICDNCGAIVTAQSGTIVTPPPPVAPVTLPPIQPVAPVASQEQCPRCGASRQPGKKFCGKCGYSYAQAQSPSQPTHPQTQSNSLITPGNMLAGKYRLDRIIGTGGMGAVCLAEDIVLKRKVVIKALLNDDDPELVEQSIKEREFLAEINHPNIVAIYDFIAQGNSGYIVMEYVEGKTLDDMLEEQGRPFDVKTGIQHIIDILPAFAYLAKLNLVYCDFKPQNVMIHRLKDGTQQAKLIDLGTVIRYGPKPDRVYGTHGFYAREAIKNPSPQTDLYTICRTLAYLITMMDVNDPIFGMPPAEKYQIFRDNPALYRLLVKGTHIDPRQRFQSVRELDDQLRGVLRLSVGGETGVPIRSHNFMTTALTKTGQVGRRGETALDEQDRAINTLRSGDQALQIGNYMGALNFYQQAAQINPKSVDAYVRLIDTFIEEGDLQNAEVHLRTVQNLAPTSWKVRWCQGRLYEAQGELQKAIDQYNDLMMDLPGELPPLEALARVYGRQGNDNEAIRLYQVVLRADPDNVDCLFGITQCLLRQQRWDEALQYLHKVNESSARYPEAQLLLCDIYLNRAAPSLPGVADIQEAARAVDKLKGRIEDARYYLVRGETYYVAWQMARAGVLPQKTPIVGVKEANVRSLGHIAEESYTLYLRCDQPLVPREDIIRRKFEVAPWHLV